MIDIDDFKNTNDTLGHLPGDEYILNIANILQERFRQTDHFCRFGGDEFVCVIQDVDENQLKANELIEAISQDSQIQTAISVGATIVCKTDRNIDDLISRADQALYIAKANRKGQYEYL